MVMVLVLVMVVVVGGLVEERVCLACCFLQL